PRQTDNKEPYDFAGSTGSGQANPFNTASVSNGSHTITAAIELSGGGTQVVKTVNATFTVSNPKTLTVTKAGAGNGTVTSSPAGINCGTMCASAFAASLSVTLTAAPVSGATFTGWLGACSGTDPCTVVMSVDRSVTATFTSSPKTLTVTKAGTGTGTVTSSPAGINCGTTCASAFAANSSVMLTAMPVSSATFTGWSGACSGTDPCTVVMSVDRSVTATFSSSASYTLLVSTSADRSSPVALNGFTASGNIYVFTSPTSGVPGARFFLDD